MSYKENIGSVTEKVIDMLPRVNERENHVECVFLG